VAPCGCFGEPAANRSLRQIADDLIKSTFRDATTAYELPNAMVGYQPGYGEFADVSPKDRRSASSDCAWWSSSPRRTGQR
jgi:hypothetical protein